MVAEVLKRVLLASAWGGGGGGGALGGCGEVDGHGGVAPRQDCFAWLEIRDMGA